MHHFVTRHAVAAAVLTLASSAAFASNTIADNFTRTGLNEVVISPFTSYSTSTLGSYAGPVEIIVSGTGFSLGNLLNDAFYSVPGGVLQSTYYLLNIGWSGANLVPLSGQPRNIDNFISFIDGVGAVGAGTAPAYDASNHTYHFVVDTPALASALQFGVSDGNFGDNGGEYRIEVYQLSVGAVPEPTTYALMLGGLGLLGCAARRRRT